MSFVKINLRIPILSIDAFVIIFKIINSIFVMNIPCKLFTSLIMLTHRSSSPSLLQLSTTNYTELVETVGKDQLTQL